MRSMGIALAAAIGLLATATATSAQGNRPVRMGLDGADFDACTPYSQITGLDRRGDNFVSVRAGPGARARELDRLGPGRLVWSCETVGGWTGIVYGPRRSLGCGVERTVPRARPYRGPCRSGWISSRYITPIAG